MHYWEQPSHARNLSDRALELMREYAIAPTPQNYELWFDYAIGQNQELVNALNTAVAEGRATDAAFTQSAYTRFFGTPRPAEIGNMGAKLKEEVQKSKTVLEIATKDIASHAKVLAEAAAALAAGGNVKGVVDRVAQSTRALQSSHATLEAHLDQTGREMETLRKRSETVTSENPTDPLTGLLSRKSFDERAEPMLSESEYNDTPFCILIANLDSFRKFNDTWGHATGDHALRLVAQCFKASTRERDAAARFGGEEFAVALPNAAIESAVRIAEKIRQTVESREITKRSTGETLGSLTLSIGVAQHRAGEPVAETMDRAAAHLDAAKRAGRNRVVSDGTGSLTEDVRARA